jgi:hypothetical protein
MDRDRSLGRTVDRGWSGWSWADRRSRLELGRTQWIRGFMAFQLACHARSVMLMVPM